MNYNLDQTQDHSNKELYAFMKNVDIPDFVKKSDDTEDVEGLNKEAFADKGRRIFPINTAERTYVSNVFFVNKQAEIEKKYGRKYAEQIKTEIEKSAKVFGIEGDLFDYSKSLFDKTASDQYVEECIYETPEGFGLYPVKTAADLKKSSVDFVKNIRNFPFTWRREMASNFVKKASDFGIDDMPDLVLKYAGMFFPDLEKVQPEINRRMRKLSSEENIDLCNNLLELEKEASSVDDVMKIAEIIYELENEEGLYDNSKVAYILGDPVDQLFTISIEKAASMLDFVENGTKKYMVNDLSKIGAAVYKEATGIDIDPSDKNELRDVVPTIPRSDMSLLEELSGLQHI